jgi:glycosyltransferase involved in cell wall biosynthesis
VNDVAVIVPAYQAEATIGGVVEHVQQAFAPHGMKHPVIVVDDGSDDETAKRASDRGASVLRHERNRGKGAALLTGLGEARARSAVTAVAVDADGQHPASEALKLALHPASDDTLLLGVRDLRGAGAPLANRFSNAFSNGFLSMVCRRSLHDTQCGLRRYPVERVLELGVRAERYDIEADILLRALRAGVPIEEVPISVVYPPEELRRTHFHSVRDPARIVFRVLHTLLTARGQP